jgi:biotin transport system substrate-specific component
MLVSSLFIRNFLFAIVFTILLIVSGFIVIPIGETAYFTFQSMIIMLAGGILGARWGVFSVLIWILLAASGLPVVSGGVGGIEAFYGPVGGYMIGYLLAAFIIGCLIRISNVSWIVLFFIYAIGGIGVINIVSICWFMIFVHVSIDLETFIQSFVSFVLYDLVKVVLATILTVIVYRTLPVLLPQARK